MNTANLPIFCVPCYNFPIRKKLRSSPLEKHIYHSKPLDSFGRAHYSDVETNTWSILLHRQNELVKPRASKEFIRGVELLKFTDEVPQHKDISAILNDHTGWGVEPVPAVIQTQIFFDLLAKKRFPAANFIRIPKELDYIKEPDIFHEIYGHCPLLTNRLCKLDV